MEAVGNCFLVGYDNSRLWSGVVSECCEELLWRVVIRAPCNLSNVGH